MSKAERSDWQLSTVLESPAVWAASRRALDATFGLYRRRVSLLRRWGVLDGAPSILDVGCGTGQYAAATSGHYLGLDLAEPYVEYARRHNRNPALHEFRAADVATLEAERRTFDIVLMVDFLHHLSEESCATLLARAARLSRRYVISLEPVTEQSNPFGRWIIDRDRGEHMRSLSEYRELFRSSPLEVEHDDALRLGPISTRAVLATVSSEHQASTGTRHLQSVAQ